METGRDAVDASIRMETGGDEVDASDVQPDLRQVGNSLVCDCSIRVFSTYCTEC